MGENGEMLLGLCADIWFLSRLLLRGGVDLPPLGPTPERRQHVSRYLWAVVPRVQLPAGSSHSGVHCPFTQHA